MGRGRGSPWVYHPRFPATFGKHWLGRGESLGDALALLPSCLANTVMAPRKQPRGHRAQWLDPPSSQLSAQSHQLGLSPHAHQHTAGIPVPGADRSVQRGLGHHFSACLPTHGLHRQPAGLGSNPVSASSQLHSLRHTMPFPGSHPGLTQAHQAQISLLGYPQFIGALSGSVFRPFLKGSPFWRLTHPLPAPLFLPGQC